MPEIKKKVQNGGVSGSIDLGGRETLLQRKVDNDRWTTIETSCLFLLRNKIIFSYKYEASIFDFYFQRKGFEELKVVNFSIVSWG